MKLKNYFKRLCPKCLLDIFNAIIIMFNQYKVPSFAKRGEHSQVGLPIICTFPKNVFLDDFTRINPGAKIITYTGKFVMKKYSEIAYGCTIVTGNHTPTVGVPQFDLGHSHLNDNEEDVVVEEDVWIGANVTILKGVTIGRGSVVGANSLVNKSVPPYSVVVGSPAHIIASKFSKEQILSHEKALYEEKDRLTDKTLNDLFNNVFYGLRHIGVE